MNDQHGRAGRVRLTATGALAALVVVGAIAGTAALAAKPPAHKLGRAAVANSTAAKRPMPPQPGSYEPFLNAVQRLVSDGTIGSAEGRVLDREIQAGSIDAGTLVASGFTPTQLQAVEQALVGVKRALGSGESHEPPASAKQSR